MQPEEYARIETELGERLTINTNADPLEAELLKQAPQDTAEIHRLASAVRGLANFEIPDTTDPGLPEENSQRPRTFKIISRKLHYICGLPCVAVFPY